MSRSLRRGSIAALAALAIAPLSSCAAGNTPETLQIKPDNVSATLSPTVLLNNIVVVTGKDSAGEHTGPASVVVNIANSGAEPVELQSITVGTGSTAAFTDNKGAAVASIVVPPGGSVAIGGAGNATALVPSASVQVGGYVPTAFAFKNGKVEAQAAVSPNKGLYAGYGPVAAEAAAASPAAGHGTATPTTGATTPAAGATTPAAGATTPAAGATGTATPGAAPSSTAKPSGAASTAAAGGSGH
ncbi:DUF461 domain-containing protein [Kitasatospora sp. NPDC054939]